jgi:hypothetical protein
MGSNFSFEKVKEKKKIKVSLVIYSPHPQDEVVEDEIPDQKFSLSISHSEEYLIDKKKFNLPILVCSLHGIMNSKTYTLRVSKYIEQTLSIEKALKYIEMKTQDSNSDELEETETIDLTPETFEDDLFYTSVEKECEVTLDGTLKWESKFDIIPKAELVDCTEEEIQELKEERRIVGVFIKLNLENILDEKDKTEYFLEGEPQQESNEGCIIS